jgi:asparagine synthase (glutamine-hydrolysing)
VSGIVAYLGLRAASAPAEVARAVLDRLAHRGPDGATTWSDGPAWLGHQLFATTPEDRVAAQPVANARGTIHLVADARLDNRDDLVRALRLERTARARSDAELLLAAYERWGESMPAELLGDFAFVVWDAERRRLLCARDHLGARQLFYRSDGSLFRCASEASALLADPAIPRTPNRAAMGLFLVEEFVERHDTLHAGVLAVPPAHVLVVEPGRAPRLRPYWAPNAFRRLRCASEAEYAERFRTVFREAVRARLRAAEPIASQLSGGLDSSSIVGEVERLRSSGAGPREPLTLIHTSFPGLDCDEASFCAAVAAHWGLAVTDVNAPDAVGSTRLDPSRAHPEVLWTPLGLTWQRQFEVLRSGGVRVLLTGIGSDQIMRRTGAEGAEALAALDLRTALAATGVAGAPLAQASWRRFLREGVRPLLPPRVDRAIRALRGQAPPRPPTWLAPHVARSISERRAAADRELRDLAAPGPATRALCDSLVRGYEVVFTLATLGPLAAHGGVELRHPYLDLRLVELMLSVPHALRCGVEVRKPLLRRAMGEDLTPLVRRRTQLTGFSSYVHRVLFEHQAERVDALFADSALAALDVVDGDKVRALVSSARRDWSLLRDVANLVSLEVWLRSGAASAAPSVRGRVPEVSSMCSERSR